MAYLHVHPGRAPFHPDPAYRVVRDVRAFGAVGDGVHDDTAAINAAICAGGRDAAVDSATTAPALVYIPPGTYRVSAPLVSVYNTHLHGDAAARPRIVADAAFVGIALIDENPYLPGGRNWYTPQNNFFRGVQNLVLDLTRMPAHTGTGIHHQVSQATILHNVHFEMAAGPASGQQGIFMENASGGFMSALSFRGGKHGAWLGNQQFTLRNASFVDCATAIYQHWGWTWTYMDVRIARCGVGLALGEFPDGGQGVGAATLVDWSVADTPVAVHYTAPGGRLVIDQVATHNVGELIGGAVSLARVPHQPFAVVRGAAQLLPALHRPACLVDAHGRWFGREKPQFPLAPHDVLDVTACGARGDGRADDTAALQGALDRAAGRVVFVPHGVYVVSDTLHVPVGTRLVGQALPVLMGAGARFNDARRPRAVVRVGAPGDTGELLIADMLFSTRAPAAGAVVLEWNVHEAYQGSAAMFDSHVRIGGTAHTGLEAPQCPKDAPLERLPRGSFLNMHVTRGASGYFQNVWVWTADHDLDYGARAQINVLSARGILLESTGPVWMYGTASEHQLLYQYALVGVRNAVLGAVQTESPYFQGHQFAHASAEDAHPDYPDPRLAAPSPLDDRALGMYLADSDACVLGAGLYSFFDSYSQAALPQHACQRVLLALERSRAWIAGLATVGATEQLVADGRRVPETPYRHGFCSTATCVVEDGTLSLY